MISSVLIGSHYFVINQLGVLPKYQFNSLFGGGMDSSLPSTGNVSQIALSSRYYGYVPVGSLCGKRLIFVRPHEPKWLTFNWRFWGDPMERPGIAVFGGND